MNGMDYAILAGIAVMIAGITAFLISKKRKGKNGCGNCPHRNICKEKID